MATEPHSHNGMLSLFSPDSWHQPAFILGDRNGLTALQEAIRLALEGEPGVPVNAPVFAADGEGYACLVTLLTTEEMWRTDAPYTDLPRYEDEPDSQVSESLTATLEALPELRDRLAAAELACCAEPGKAGA